MTNKIIKIIIVGAGFGGLNAAMMLANKKGVHVTIIDEKNHHLFQPLLYQVATAGLSAEEIATPIRSIFAKFQNITVILGKVSDIQVQNQLVITEDFKYFYDFLILASGATHNYFGKNEWQSFAPGIKTIEQAIEIRKKILLAFELAEKETDPLKIEQFLTFVVIGGGPTGVELAGAIAEMSRHTLQKDFRNIDPKKAKIILIEAGPCILSSFSAGQSQYAQEKLERQGVFIKLNSKVNSILGNCISLQQESILAATIIWAAGIQPSSLGKMLGAELDQAGRVKVQNTLTLQNKNNIFVIGDLAHFAGKNNRALPGLAPVALQQGIHSAKNILRVIHGKEMLPFCYLDKGQMATIGRGYAIVEISNFKLNGFLAWMIWIFIHIAYLIGFRNKILVLTRLAWLYFYSRGARLI